jgi:hypothetical protein
MSSPSPSPYRLVVSGTSRAQFRELHRNAPTPEFAARLLAAARTIVARLAADPGEFGEPLRDLHHLGLQMRHGVERPLVVRYAIDEQRRLVYVVGFRALTGTGV